MFFEKNKNKNALKTDINKQMFALNIYLLTLHLYLE